MRKDIWNVDCGIWQVDYEQNTSWIVEDINDDSIPDRPSTSTIDENIEAVKKTILDNLRITIRELADDVSILFGSRQAIFTDFLGMKRTAAKIVPELLNF